MYKAIFEIIQPKPIINRIIKLICLIYHYNTTETSVIPYDFYSYVQRYTWVQYLFIVIKIYAFATKISKRLKNYNFVNFTLILLCYYLFIYCVGIDVHDVLWIVYHLNMITIVGIFIILPFYYLHINDIIRST